MIETEVLDVKDSVRITDTDTVILPESKSKEPSKLKRNVGVGAGLVGGLLGALAFGFVAGATWRADLDSDTPSDTPGFNGRDIACVQVLRNGGVPRDCDRMYHLDFYP